MDPEYYAVEDSAPLTSYKDPYIVKVPKTRRNGEEDSNISEASEQIFLFNKAGESIELSNKSKIINQIRNDNISIKRLYIPEIVKNKLIGGQDNV